MVSGTASSGLLICLLRIATKAALPSTPEGLRKSTGIYFAAAGALTLACCVVHVAVLPRLPVVKYYRCVDGRRDGLLQC